VTRVVITGAGVICAPGNNRTEFLQSLREGRGGIGRITDPESADLKFSNGGEVRGYNPEDHFSLKEADMIDRFSQFAVIAAREAVAQSGLKMPEDAAIVTGSCVGGKTSENQGFYDVYKLGKPRIHPMTIPKSMANGGASAVSLEFGIRGPVFTISTACASSAHAIGQAFQMVRTGQVDVALTGGSEAPFSFGILKAWEAMRVVAPEICRPFSKDRTGMILGEGGAMFVIESLEHAQARGAQIIAEIAGCGMSSDAHHITQPSAEGAAKAIRMALKDAGITPEQVGYVNAHGTGTGVNDPTETKALHLAFGDHAKHLAVSSTKAMHGHTLGAAGAIEAVATVLALQHGFLPPTIHFTEPDPECDLDYIPNQSREAQVEYAISNSFAFGGLNAVLALKRF
jgi:nodulation protein E